MKYEITSPDGQRFEVTAPDGASQDQILAYAQSQFQPKEQYKPANPTDEMSTGQQLLAGIGGGMVNLGRGVKQRLGMMSPQEVADARKVDAPLMDTAAGAVGNFLGTMAGALPAMFVPGANTVAGAAALGGAMGSLQPTAPGESALQNAALGAALGGGSQYGIGKIAGIAGNLLSNAEAKGVAQQAQNAVRDATLQEARSAGYVAPPSLSDAGTIPRVLEGISGKFKTNQAAAIKNQNVTNQLARKALGLPEDAPLTADTMQAVRNQAFQDGYAPVKAIGEMPTDKAFTAALDDLSSKYVGAERSFPTMGMHGKPEVPAVVSELNQLRVPKFNASDALDKIQILRDDASKAFASGDTGMGKALRGAAKALEDQIERNLAATGKDGKVLLDQFRNSRALMAKAHNVEQAIIEGGGTVNAKALGAALQRGKPLSGDLKTIGAFANNFKDVAGVPASGFANPITTLDAFGAAGMAGMGAGPMSIALPAARVASRAAILSGPAQRMMGPNYGPSATAKLTPEMLRLLERNGLGGLLGSAYSVQ